MGRGYLVVRGTSQVTAGAVGCSVVCKASCTTLHGRCMPVVYLVTHSCCVMIKVLTAVLVAATLSASGGHWLPELCYHRGSL